MNICMVISMKIPPEDGGGNFVLNLSKELVKKGHTVTIITRGGCNSTRKILLDGITIYYVTYIPLYPFHIHIHGLFVNSLFKKIESNFDVIHYQSPLPPIVHTTLPSITTLHLTVASEKKIHVADINSLGHKLYSLITYYIEKKRLEKTNKITVVSSTLKQEIHDLYNIELSNIDVIGNAVDPNVFYPTKKGQQIYILYTGRWSVEKGINDFIECGFKICEKYPDVHFILTGKGPLFNMLSAKINKSIYSKRFIIHGYVTKELLIKLYQNATIFVLPSYSEGLPTTLLEAMSCGIPVIATSIDGVLDVIEHDKNGILIPPRSPEKMYQAITYLLDNDEIRSQMGYEARQIIENKYNWENLSNIFIKYYHSLTKN